MNIIIYPLHVQLKVNDWALKDKAYKEDLKRRGLPCRFTRKDWIDNFNALQNELNCDLGSVEKFIRNVKYAKGGRGKSRKKKNKAS